MKNEFITQKPQDTFLSTLVDSYFYIDIPVDTLSETQEYVMPFPRITFGYFFNHPFMVTNHDLEECETVDMAISRISTHKITVLPLTDRIKIIGAHAKPYILAYLTEVPIGKLPWLINTVDLFGTTAQSFREKILQCHQPEEMFAQVEQVFLNTLLNRNFQTVTKAVDLIEKYEGNIKLAEVADHLGVTDRTLRGQFHKHIGCAPKDFIQLVQLKKSVHQMSATDDSLTDITYDNSYFDQAHFIKTFKKITGKPPKEIRKQMPNFRFLQF